MTKYKGPYVDVLVIQMTWLLEQGHFEGFHQHTS